jgi:hypothetical protein
MPALTVSYFFDKFLDYQKEYEISYKYSNSKRIKEKLKMLEKKRERVMSVEGGENNNNESVKKQKKRPMEEREPRSSHHNSHRKETQHAGNHHHHHHYHNRSHIPTISFLSTL